jgi:hypothetical protein
MRAMFRFMIRDVLWLTVVVTLACGWWLNRSHLITTRQSAIAAQTKAESDTKEMQNAIRELYDALGRRGLTTAGEFGKKVEVVGPIRKSSVRPTVNEP